MHQPPTSVMDHQCLIINKEIWCYGCKTCSEVFTSSQGLVGHQRSHILQGTWVRGASRDKFFCPSAHLATFYSQLGSRKSTPTVLLYRLRQRKLMMQGPHRLSGHRGYIVRCSPKAKALRGTKASTCFRALGLEMLPMTSYFVHLLSSQPSTVSWLNPNVAQAARPLETTDSSSTVTVTADLMGGKEINED
ncbi:hypothetical protein HAX54_030086 [Datura stramonium]|uniref:C2H2-type domain-containing protein n=1 Tax=Datura stramonium TaxID=4076 RepID=A0ABS8V741_DATST|nr:hypothetical protein [Datura stramonium]